ncbi:MAG: HAD hydrolase-like protein [Thermomicrobiales bacterium]
MTDSNRRYDLVIFDLDGTLTDSHVGIARSVQHALAQFDIVVDDLDAMRPFVGPPLRDTFAGHYGFDPDQTVRAVAAYRERYGTVGLLENEMFPQTPALLQAVADTGATLVVASTKGEPFVHRILEHFALDHFFAVMGGASFDDAISTKADVISRVLRDLPEVPPPDRIIMVGDREHDIEGARELGIETISVRFGYAAPGELEAHAPLAIASTHDELAALLGVSLAPVAAR